VIAGIARFNGARMTFRFDWALAGTFAVAAILACGPALKIFAQNPPPQQRPVQELTTRGNLPSPKVYEDNEVKIPIPSGWSVVVPESRPISKGDYPSVAQIFAPAPGNGLFLSKRNYILILAYETGHASGVTGGRFIEVFQIPWIDDPFEGVDCGSLLQRNPQPVNDTLKFINLILNPADPEVREKCKMLNDLGGRGDDGRARDSFVGQKWFAGYFTTARGGWFFESDGIDCGQKSYILTSAAKTSYELPVADSPDLKNVLKEAIDIVASIRYKRCPPSNERPR
jgi:hypothetical protein